MAPATAEAEKGELTGTPYGSITPPGGNTIKTETYIGIGPLVIPTIRGDIKALSGDTIILLEDPDDPNKRPRPFYVLPPEVIEALGITVVETHEEEASPQLTSTRSTARESSSTHATGSLGAPRTPVASTARK